MVARGEAEIGFQQMSELVHVAGIDVLGPIPPDVQLVTVVSGCVHANAKQPAAAKAWANFLASPGRRGGAEEEWTGSGGDIRFRSGGIRRLPAVSKTQQASSLLLVCVLI